VPCYMQEIYFLRDWMTLRLLHCDEFPSEGLPQGITPRSSWTSQKKVPLGGEGVIVLGVEFSAKSGRGFESAGHRRTYLLMKRGGGAEKLGMTVPRRLKNGIEVISGCLLESLWGQRRGTQGPIRGDSRGGGLTKRSTTFHAR